MAANGNLTGISGPRNVTYTYDTWNNLTGAQVGTNPQVTYLNDALGRTASRTTSSTAVLYGYVGTSEEPVWTSEDSGATTYAHAPGGPLARRQGSATRYFISDLHGDVVGLADPAGAVVGTTSYSPWGEKRAANGETDVLGFQADLTDAETGLVDMQTRHYDPVIGRFNTKDVLFGEPVRPTSLNQFAYGEGNPVTHTDPTGMGIPCGGSELSPSGWANCGPTGTESTGDGDSWWGSTPHPADASDDIFLHGPGYTDVPLPIWTTPYAALVTYNPRLILPIRKAIMEADPEDVSSVLKGLVKTAGSRTVLVTGWVPRAERVGQWESGGNCLGLLGCFSVSKTSFQPPKPAPAAAPAEGGGCSGFLGCALGFVKKAAGVVAVVGAGVAAAAAVGAAIATAPLTVVGLAVVAGMAATVATYAAFVSTTAECLDGGPWKPCLVGGVTLGTGKVLGTLGGLLRAAGRIGEWAITEVVQLAAEGAGQLAR